MSEERRSSLIIYRFDPAVRGRRSSGASQPAVRWGVQAWLKRVAAQAKMDYRKTCILHRRLEQGRIHEDDLEEWQRENLRKLADGSLLRRTNNAVAAFGHGMLRRGDDTMHIGGSTGGVTRFLLDGHTEPDVDAFLAER